MSATRYYQAGPSYGVLPFPGPMGIGGPGPATQTTQGQYPPTAAGGTATRVLPGWLHAAVEGFKGRMRAATSPTPRNARLAPNQGYQANQTDMPKGQTIPYGASPRLFDEYQEGALQPGPGGTGGTQMYSTVRASMDDQPAFEIDPPIGQGRTITNLFEGLNGFSPMRSGLPTFFPVANRSLNSGVGTGVDNHPVGVSYLVIPPDRYRRPNRAQPVRGKSGQSGGRFSRAGTLPMVFGS